MCSFVVIAASTEVGYFFNFGRVAREKCPIIYAAYFKRLILSRFHTNFVLSMSLTEQIRLNLYKLSFFLYGFVCWSVNWRLSIMPVNSFEVSYTFAYCAVQLVKDSVQIFTDGSKLGRTVGGGIFSEPLGIAEFIRLSDYCSVFQAEFKIIWDSNIPNGNITILPDSQAAIRTLGSNVMNSRTVYNCRKHLNKVAKGQGVPWHNYIPGNRRSDELARRGSTIELSDEFLNIGIPFRNLMIDDKITDSINIRWAASDKRRVARMI